MTGHVLGHASARPKALAPERNMSPVVVGITRTLMHCVMIEGACRQPQVNFENVISQKLYQAEFMMETGAFSVLQPCTNVEERRKDGEDGFFLIIANVGYSLACYFEHRTNVCGTTSSHGKTKSYPIYRYSLNI